MAFAPDGRLFYNELRTGNVRVIQNRTVLPQPFASLNVTTSGETGLLGLALDPDFASNRFVYVLYSDPGGFMRVVRFTESNNVGTNMTTIVDRLPMARIHNGGNIAIGPGGHLFITIGDNGQPANSQNPNSLSGKLLRYNRDGSVPGDNPFGGNNPAFNLGLRNSFDITFHPQTGVVYATENGPECDDELNRVVAGANYGWRPDYACGESNTQFVQPIVRFDARIAPTGVTFYTGTVFPQFTGSLFMVSFNDGVVRRFTVDESRQGALTSQETVTESFGHLYDVVQGPDGFLYLSSDSAIHRMVPQ